jgi:TatD DNase family protein
LFREETRKMAAEWRSRQIEGMDQRLHLVDTHAHLTDSRFAGEVPEVLERARHAGVDWVVTIASHLDDARAGIALAEANSALFATVGIHPHSADASTETALAEVEELALHPRVVAIGETGLDFFYDNSSREAQRASFLRHLEIAESTGLPVVVHSRDADDEVSEAIASAPGVRGVLHCFSGGERLLETALASGWYISFAGMVTFAKWTGADLLRAVPLDRLLIETDSPYLAPAPLRGKRNEPANVRRIAERAAEIRGEDVAELARATSRNAAAFYRIEP